MAYLTVDVDLDDLSDDDLISELEIRYLDDDEKLRLLDIVATEEAKKFKLMLLVKDKYSLLELEGMFKEQFPDTHIPKEQLTLQL